jgi:hypothetical protein
MRPIAEHIEYSTSLENLIQPTELHTTQIFSDQSVHIYEVENFIFLGYSVIFLSALAIIKYRQKHMVLVTNMWNFYFNESWS